MTDEISPRFLMKLVKEVESAIWEEFKTYKEVSTYIRKWYKHDDDINGYWENFSIINKPSDDIDLLQTLHSMTGPDILRVAIDLGVDTPDFIPSIPTFKNSLKTEYKTAYSTFEKAYKNIETDPSLAIGLANSALESIIKEILNDNRLSHLKTGNETLYKLTNLIVKEFKLIDKNIPTEVRNIGSSLLNINQNIEKIRSEKTNFHGKTNDEYLIEDEIYAILIINSVTTVGLFLNSYFKYKFPKPVAVKDEEYDDLPF